MNILIFGPNGSGKGTQGNLVKAKYNLAHIESAPSWAKGPRNTSIAATWCPTTSPSPWCWRP